MGKKPWSRPGEKVGGGYFVFRRGKTTGRVCPPSDRAPFEHPTIESALAEMNRLAAANRGQAYVVLQQVASEQYAAEERRDLSPL